MSNFGNFKQLPNRKNAVAKMQQEEARRANNREWEIVIGDMTDRMIHDLVYAQECMQRAESEKAAIAEYNHPWNRIKRFLKIA
ncbi:hypothetical protein [Ralstonia phage RSP15]|uniref:hypothetical protein n=1 Tax=Ralstonia phage RSP15 TaxID=1785960 RepID=UPI00074D46DA|nr:hypothetical protein BH754_gp208 [Ralstonia phage RSP15]BAU40098.1 hypothetical protein [Ralstonia phage RSP15]